MGRDETAGDRAGPVVDDKRLPELFGELGADNAEMMSVPPPAVDGTMIVTGRAGYSSAETEAAVKARLANAAANAKA